jgi:hypothetical protein
MDAQKEFKAAKEIVHECLTEDARCRNDDLFLILKVWQKKQQINCFVPYDKLSEMIKPETITRVRRKIQNDDGELLPTDPEVLRRRKIKQQQVHDWAVGKEQ